ncbi:MAG: hypothetical protein QNJ98_04090 [Planctomycetota bacterium]|nr:hypothetical protein [Planctomycetota bacterium]
MKAHAMRRSIWLLNLGLAAAVVAVGAWYVLDVKEAVAKTPRPVKGKAPKQWAEIVRSFNKQIEEARTDVLRAPVRTKDVQAAFQIDDHKKRDPVHFIFTGDLPPPYRVDKPVEETKPKLPTGLDAVGKISWLIWGGAESTTVVFAFNDGKKKFFKVGQFVKKAKEDPDRFKLTKATLPEPDLYKIEYEVWEDGKPLETETIATIAWDNRKPEPEGGVIRIVPDPAKKAAEDAAKKAAGDAAPGEGDSEKPAAEDKPAEVVVVGGKSGLELTPKDLKPEIKVVNTRLREVRFDDNSYKYFKARDTKKMVESVKTREVNLPGGKKGVAIIDPGEAPADIFDFRRGDVVISINGQPTPDRASIIRVAEAIPESATRITIVVDRNGRQITFNVDPRDPKTRRKAAQYGRDR